MKAEDSAVIGNDLGRYRVLDKLGEGGMGEVYRARDTALDREVAIKILPQAFATDPDRLARLEREAKLLASLNHPNIAAVYSLERADDRLVLVMELVPGETLEERIHQGALPLDEVRAVAGQIARGLEAAHAKGIVHRDLKPANIKLTPGGQVKLLDFGLAKAFADDLPSNVRHLSNSPTLGVATLPGLILGTASYMSPEQARGKPTDTRTDVWAFGCVLFEMLAGAQAFPGDTVTDTLAAIVRAEPNWSALSPTTPPTIRSLLRRCLQKDPDRRLHHMADVRLELEDAENEPALPAVASPVPVRRSGGWTRSVPWTIAALALGVATWATAFRTSRRASTTPVVRLELNLPAGVELFNSSGRSIAVSPDGNHVAFVGVLGGSRQIYLRALDNFEAIPLRGSDSATACFFSPDGRSVGLVTAAGVLKTISLADRLVSTVGNDVNFLYGAAWLPDDRIVFVRGGALWQIPRTGGPAKPLTTIGGPRGDTIHAWPSVLPGGKTILFTATTGDQSRIDALVLATGERRTIVERGTLPLYAGSGHLVFFREGELLAAPFDAARIQVTGPPVRAIDTLPAMALGVPEADVSPSGTLVYTPTIAVSRLVWVSRQGAEQPLNDVLRSYATPRIAADGNRIVVQAGDLWIQDSVRATFTRLTSRDAVTNAFPVWTSDGRRVAYRSPNGIRVQDADGSGRAEVLAGTSDFDYPAAFTPDGETLVILRSSQDTSFDIYAFSLRSPSELRSILKTPAYEGGARLSPDGRWLTYISNESGQNEVYVRPFPGPDRRWQISTQGGTQAIWNPNGREIFYREGNKMMAVGVATSPELVLSPPRPLFEQRYAFGAGITIANYDVTRDGQRFVMVKDESSAGRLNIVLNWFGELERRAGPSK